MYFSFFSLSLSLFLSFFLVVVVCVYLRPTWRMRNVLFAQYYQIASNRGACLINDVQSINLWPIYSETTAKATTTRATAGTAQSAIIMGQGNNKQRQWEEEEGEGRERKSWKWEEPQQFCAIWQQFLCIYHTRRPSAFWLMIARDCLH